MPLHKSENFLVDFSNALLKKKIVICVGAGGVGKTTMSVAIGFLAASLGKKTLIMTIDPAKRLADALGIHVGGKPVLFEQKLNLEQKWQPKAPLYAMMLDTKMAWRDLVTRLSSSGEVRESIFSNRFYKHLSEEMAGSGEFVACEALYTLASESDFDLIVLDTPPTAQALDFLTAPERVLSFLDRDAFRLFSAQGFSFFAGTQRILMGVIGKFVPGHFLQELIDFLNIFSELYEPLVKRAHSFLHLLKSQETMFSVVVAPRTNAIRESIELVQALFAEKFAVEALIVNQVSPLLFFQWSLLEQREALRSLLFSMVIEPQKRDQLSSALSEMLDEESKMMNEEEKLQSQLQQAVSVPLFLQCPKIRPDLNLSEILQALLPRLSK